MGTGERRANSATGEIPKVRRVFFFLVGIVSVATLLIARDAKIALFPSVAMAQGLRNERVRITPQPPIRGEILDDQGAVLAFSMRLYRIWAISKEMPDTAQAAHRLAGVLGVSEDTLKSELSKPYAVLAPAADEQTMQLVQGLHLQGVGYDLIQRRAYPDGSLFEPILGVTGADPRGTLLGLSGIESSENSWLVGTPGVMAREVDGLGVPLPGTGSSAVDALAGDNLHLTINARWQQIVAHTLAADAAKYKVTGAAIGMIMDDRTGAIRALVELPSFDPNQSGWTQQDLNNPAVQQIYEPGSTFKAITSAIGISLGLVTPQSILDCPSSIVITGVTVHNWEPGWGPITLTRALDRSCDTAYATLGMTIPPDAFHQGISDFGLTSDTGIDLPGETPGFLPPPSEWARPLTRATVGFGQSAAVTPIAMLRAVAALGNGGYLVTPHLLSSVTAPDGQLVYAYATHSIPLPGIAPQAVQETKAMMQDEVANGTGYLAAVSGYTVYGKTGTAEIAGKGGYIPGDYAISFMGGVEGTDLVGLVVYWHPTNVIWGGDIAAPTFRDIMSAILLHQPPIQNGTAQTGG